MPLKINFKKQILPFNGKVYFWLRLHESFLLALTETEKGILIELELCIGLDGESKHLN